MESGVLARNALEGVEATDPLARPVWGTLTTHHARFAEGGDLARRFQPDVGPFAAAREDTPACLAALAALAPADGSLFLLQAGAPPVPPGLVAVRRAAGVQMIAEDGVVDPADPTVERLGEGDAADMRALAVLTEPGPFLARTHHLGAFWGVKIDGRLAAMAGERMKLPGFTEVSGVCTHPDIRGRGLAAVLTATAAAHIAARGETPFLHAYADNAAAIRVYERLGFRLRQAVTLTQLRRA